MNVLFISTHGEGFGGSEYLWFLTAREAIKCGHQVYVAVNSTLYSTPQMQQLSDSGTKMIVQKSINSSLLFGKVKYKLKKRFPMWFRRFREVPFGDMDVVCVSQAGTYDICRDDELVVEIKKHNLPFFLISQYHDENGGLEKWKYDKARKIFPLAKRFYFVSKRNKEICELLISKNLSNASVINNPFRFNSKNPQPYPNVDRTIHFACIARLDTRVKCQNILFKILSGEIWSSRDWHLNLFGEGKDQSYLEDLIDHFKLEDRVTLHGHVENIEEVWQTNHLLLLPSIGEGIPLSLIEAFGFGRPAVVTDVGGNDVLVEDGITGMLAISFSEKYFGEAMERMWSLKRTWHTLGANAFQRLHDRLNTKPQKTILNDLTYNE